MTELYKKHRPTKFSQVRGQDEAVRTLNGMLKQGRVPHFILFDGPSGCGKTTLARIMQSKLHCDDADFNEVNCADFRGIDMVRDIRSRSSLSALGGNGSCRIWLIDECHKLSNDAQNAFLKLLEDTPAHVYFMLATTESGKLLRTIMTRASVVPVRLLKPDEMLELLQEVVKAEGAAVTEAVLDRIVEVAEGSPRMALVILNQVVGLEDEADQLAVVRSSESKREAIELSRALLNPRASWPELATILKGLEVDDYERLRYHVLDYATKVMLGGGKMVPRAAVLIDSFAFNFYDSKKAGLVSACYRVVASK